MGTLVTTVAATGLPVSLADAKHQCRITDNEHDTLLRRLIGVATERVERHTGLVLMQRTLRLDLDGFTGTVIPLQTTPVQSVTSIQYDDTTDAEQTLDTSEYYVVATGVTPYVKPVSLWPATYRDKPARVRITFVAGYASQADVPEDIRQAILINVYEMFENSDSAGDDDFMGQGRRVWQ